MCRWRSCWPSSVCVFFSILYPSLPSLHCILETNDGTLLLPKPRLLFLSKVTRVCCRQQETFILNAFFLSIYIYKPHFPFRILLYLCEGFLGWFTVTIDRCGRLPTVLVTRGSARWLMQMNRFPLCIHTALFLLRTSFWLCYMNSCAAVCSVCWWGPRC